jgi:hypothetical protein
MASYSKLLLIVCGGFGFALPLSEYLESRFPNGRGLTRTIAHAVADKRERRTLLAQPHKVVDRLKWVADERSVPVDRIIQEIRGARTSVGVVLKSVTGGFLAPGAPGMLAA